MTAVYLLHVGPDLGVRGSVDLVAPVHRNLDLLIQLEDDHRILKVPTTHKHTHTHTHTTTLDTNNTKRIMGRPVFGLDFRCVKGEGPKLYNGILYVNEGVVLHTYGHGIRQPMAEPQHI